MSALSRKHRVTVTKATQRPAFMQTFVVWSAAASTLIMPAVLIVGAIALLR